MKSKKELMFKGERESFEDAEFKEKLRKYLPDILAELMRDGTVMLYVGHYGKVKQTTNLD